MKNIVVIAISNKMIKLLLWEPISLFLAILIVFCIYFIE